MKTAMLLLALSVSTVIAADRPNILWLVSEDNNPYLGCYGDKIAQTPVIDALAKDGILFEHCHSGAPVCAPSRFTIISGMYPASCGPANQMRAKGNIPSWLRGFPAFLREAGYFTSNNSKTDYNAPIEIKDAWDENGKNAHWEHRKKGQPFFSVFNMEITHESCLFPNRWKEVAAKTDPASVRIPAYQPDVPEFRRDRAHYYDCMTAMDARVGKFLKQLEDDGLAEDTIVFYYGDNGGILPRSKRFLYDTGTHVPLIIHFPKKFQHLAPADMGTRKDGVVAFIDFAPTVLSLAGIKPKDYMEGTALAGEFRGTHGRYAFAGRDRMDGTLDMSRSVKDERFCYIRNYQPHLPYSVYVEYQFKTASYQAWQRLHDEGKLTGLPEAFFHEKPAEELYETANDPDEVHNLAGDPKFRDTLERMRAALRDHLLHIRDNGFLPESSPQQGYDTTRDEAKYPFAKILEVADAAIQRDPANLPKFEAWLDGEHEGIRYWAAMGCVMLGEKAAHAGDKLKSHLKDPSSGVSLSCADALCRMKRADEGLPVLEAALTSDSIPVATQAANILDYLGPVARPALPAMKAAMAREEGSSKFAGYPGRMLRHAVEQLK